MFFQGVYVIHKDNKKVGDQGCNWSLGPFLAVEVVFVIVVEVALERKYEN